MLVHCGGNANESRILECFPVTEEDIVPLVRLYVILNGWKYLRGSVSDASLFDFTADNSVKNQDRDY